MSVWVCLVVVFFCLFVFALLYFQNAFFPDIVPSFDVQTVKIDLFSHLKSLCSTHATQPCLPSAVTIITSNSLLFLSQLLPLWLNFLSSMELSERLVSLRSPDPTWIMLQFSTSLLHEMLNMIYNLFLENKFKWYVFPLHLSFPPP